MENYLEISPDIKIRTYNMNYPTDHIKTPITQFITKTFVVDGVRCFYPVDIDKKSSSKSDMTLDEFRLLQEGKPIMRTWNKGTPKETTTEWRPTPARDTNIFECNFSKLNLFTTDIDDYVEVEGKKNGVWDFEKTPEIFKNCPYTKSRSKGNPHFWYRIEGLDVEALKDGGFRNASKNLTFCNDGEILTNHSWEDKTGYIYNWNGEVPTIKWDDLKKLMKNTEVVKWEKKAGLCLTDSDNDSEISFTSVPSIMATPTYTPTPTNNKQLEQFRKMLPCYSEARIRGTGDFETGTWKRWTLAIFNSFGADGREDWDRVSKEKGGNTYDLYKNVEIWNQCEKMKQGKKKIGFGSLIYWAKEDNKELFDKIFDIQIDWERITHQTVATEIYNRIMNDKGTTQIIYTGKGKDMAGYMFNGTYWEQLPLHNAEIKRKYFTEIYDYYMAEFAKVEHLYDERAFAIKKSIQQLDNVNFRESVIRLFQSICYKDKIEWNTKHHLFAFDDAIYDLEKGEFITPNPDDYINITCGYKYGKPNKDRMRILQREFIEYFKNVFGDIDVVNYVLKLLASFLRQENPEEKAYFWLGSGRNSKGTLTKFLQKSLGNYFGEYSIENYTTAQTKADAPNNNLASNRYSRVHNTSEVGEDAFHTDKAQTFLTANFKRASGGDIIETRPTFGKMEDMIRFRMGKTLVQTNLMPTIIGIELEENISLRERVVIVPFPYSFVDDEEMIASNPNKFKKRDDKVGDMLEKEEYKIAFITMLLNEYKNYLNDGLKQPKAVVEEKQKYFGGADKVKQWVSNNLVEEEPNANGEYTKKMDMRDQLFTAFQADGGGISYAKFKAGIERVCGKRQTKTGKGMFGNSGYYYLQGYKWTNEEITITSE